MGARGNSGVILSQLVAGALREQPEGEIDATGLARMLRGASDAGYAAVRNPQEGTILTVARALAERAEALAEDGQAVEDALADVFVAGERRLEETTEQLDVLKQAGVVDAGGAGLIEIVRGIASYVRGEELPEPAPLLEAIPLDAIHQELSKFRYCTSFFVEGDRVDPDELEVGAGEARRLPARRRGPPARSRCTCTPTSPGRALALATAVGVIEEVDVKNMHVQTTRARGAAASSEETAVCGAVSGLRGRGQPEALREPGRGLCRGRAVDEPVDRGDRRRYRGPARVRGDRAPEQQERDPRRRAGGRCGRSRPGSSRRGSVQAGLGAMVAFDPNRPADENGAEMDAASAGVRSGAVTQASRDAVVGDLAVEEGQFLGLLEGEPVVAGPVLQPVARDLLERLLENGPDVLTILVGEALRGSTTSSRSSERSTRTSRSRCTTAASPTILLLFGAE